MANENGDIQRWEYALKLSESNNEQIGKLTERIDALAEVSERHEREQQRLRGAMMAAFEAYLSGENGEEKA
jgi:hypothetical protein